MVPGAPGARLWLRDVRAGRRQGAAPDQVRAAHPGHGQRVLQLRRGRAEGPHASTRRRCRAPDRGPRRWATGCALDPDWRSPQPESYEARIEQFRNAYVKQTQLRKEAEAKLDAAVVSRMDMQDMLLSGAIARPSSLGAGASANKGEGDDGAGGGNEDVGIFEYLGDECKRVVMLRTVRGFVTYLS